MTWSVMSDVPNPLFDVNGNPYSGAVLKAYLPGTTTSTSIAIDSAGGSPQTSITYNAEGKLEVSGNEELPYIDRKHKWGIFANATDATANTPFYMGPFDNVEKTADSVQVVKQFATLALAVADTGLVDGDVLTTGDRGGATWNVVLSSTVTENTYNIVQCTGVGTLSLVLKSPNKVYTLRQLGAVFDDATDDSAVIEFAFQQTGWNVVIDDGTALCNANLTAPVCASIKGSGLQTSIIHAGAAVTKLLPLDGGFPDIIENFQLTGNAVTNARGLVVGDSVLTAHLDLTKILVQNFTGTGAANLEIINAVEVNYHSCQFIGGTKNIIFTAGAVSGTPTTQVFSGGLCDSAVEEGIHALGANQCKFTDEFAIQNSGKQGLLVETGVGSNVADFVLDGVYFEGNYGATTTEYQAKIDGSAAGTARVHIKDSFFNGSGATAKSIHITGTNSRRCLIQNNQVPNLTGQILFDGSAQADSIDWPSNLAEDVLTLGNITLQNNTAGFEGAWVAWAPTYSSSVGNDAATYTTTPTTQLARYKRIGKTLHITIRMSAVLIAVAPTYLEFTLPTPYSSNNTNTFTPMVVRNNTYDTGQVSTEGSTILRVYKDAAGNAFTSGATIEVYGSFTIEID